MAGFATALVQIAIQDGERPSARLERGLDVIETLDHSPKLVVFPELWTVGYFNVEEYELAAEPLDGTTVARLSIAARRRKLWLHGGSIVERSSGGSLYNTSLLFDPEGRLAASYRKTHLFGFTSGEKKILRAGESPVSFQAEIGNLGFTTCYDLRFPELYRCLSSRGAEAVFVASAWPAARLEHWVILARARAIENLFYVVACNAAGSNLGNELGGNSMIVDPWGNVVARAGPGECVLYGEMNLESVWTLRAQFPVLRDRRW